MNVSTPIIEDTDEIFRAENIKITCTTLNRSDRIDRVQISRAA